MIRTRYGDFCYSDYEFRVIAREIRKFRKLGAEGVSMGLPAFCEFEIIRTEEEKIQKARKELDFCLMIDNTIECKQ